MGGPSSPWSRLLINTFFKYWMFVLFITIVFTAYSEFEEIGGLKPFDFLVLSSDVYEDNSVESHDGWLRCQSMDDEETGYFGAVYWKESTKELVFAHRGTELSSWEDIMADRDLLDGITTEQIVSARTFVDSVVNNMTDYSVVAHTGHSLGAFLAEVEACRGGTKAVTFESPGSHGEIVEQGLCTVPEITSNTIAFLSAPNKVNTNDIHVGTIYRIFPRVSTGVLSYLFSQHRIVNLFTCFNSYTREPKAWMIPTSPWPRGADEYDSWFDSYVDNPHFWDLQLSHLPRALRLSVLSLNLGRDVTESDITGSEEIIEGNIYSDGSSDILYATTLNQQTIYLQGNEGEVWVSGSTKSLRTNNDYIAPLTKIVVTSVGDTKVYDYVGFPRILVNRNSLNNFVYSNPSKYVKKESVRLFLGSKSLQGPIRCVTDSEGTPQPNVLTLNGLKVELDGEFYDPYSGEYTDGEIKPLVIYDENCEGKITIVGFQVGLQSPSYGISMPIELLRDGNGDVMTEVDPGDGSIVSHQSYKLRRIGHYYTPYLIKYATYGFPGKYIVTKVGVHSIGCYYEVYDTNGVDYGIRVIRSAEAWDGECDRYMSFSPGYSTYTYVHQYARSSSGNYGIIILPCAKWEYDEDLEMDIIVSSLIIVKVGVEGDIIGERKVEMGRSQNVVLHNYGVFEYLGTMYIGINTFQEVFSNLDLGEPFEDEDMIPYSRYYDTSGPMDTSEQESGTYLHIGGVSSLNYFEFYSPNYLYGPQPTDEATLNYSPELCTDTSQNLVMDDPIDDLTILMGSRGDDTVAGTNLLQCNLFGGAGNDIIVSSDRQRSRSVVSGGMGDDVFQITASARDSTTTISDFDVHGENGNLIDITDLGSQGINIPKDLKNLFDVGKGMVNIIDGDEELLYGTNSTVILVFPNNITLVIHGMEREEVISNNMTKLSKYFKFGTSGLNVTCERDNGGESKLVEKEGEILFIQQYYTEDEKFNFFENLDVQTFRGNLTVKIQVPVHDDDNCELVYETKNLPHGSTITLSLPSAALILEGPKGDIIDFLNSEGNVMMKPVENYYGEVWLNYTVSDGSSEKSFCTVISGKAVNDPPKLFLHVRLPDVNVPSVMKGIKKGEKYFELDLTSFFVDVDGDLLICELISDQGSNIVVEFSEQCKMKMDLEKILRKNYTVVFRVCDQSNACSETFEVQVNNGFISLTNDVVGPVNIGDEKKGTGGEFLVYFGISSGISLAFLVCEFLVICFLGMTFVVYLSCFVLFLFLCLGGLCIAKNRLGVVDIRNEKNGAIC